MILMSSEAQTGYDRATRRLKTRILSFAIPHDETYWPLLADSVEDAKKEALDMGETDLTVVPDH